MANKSRNDVFRRLTSLFRGGPMVRRKVKAFRSPTASTAVEIFKKSYSQVYSNALNAYGAYDRMCIDLDTKIPIPGPERFKTLRQLIHEHPNGEKFIVYTYDHELGRITPAWAHHPRSSGIKDTVKITFDDGSELVCTPDHPCMKREGTYCDAGELKPGDSMMPFYRKVFNGHSKHDGKRFTGYSSIYTMDRSESSWHGWTVEHRLVAEWTQDRKQKKFDEHIHHIDHNPENNNPENLEFVDAGEHLAEHGRIGALVWQNNREKMLFSLQRAWDEDDGSRRAKLSEFNRRPDIREKRQQHFKNKNLSNDPKRRFEIASQAKERYTKAKECLMSMSDVDVKAAFNAFNGDVAAFGKMLGGATRCMTTSWLRKRGIDIPSHNHKVISVVPWHKIEVGDLTVDGYENFATDSIICHNSRYADFCFSGDTQVYTTRGVKTFKELYDEATKLGPDQFRCKVYSYDRMLRQTVIADAHNPRIAKDGEKQPILRVTFEKHDGTTGYVDVTPDHKFILRDGTEKEAHELSVGMALMPFLAWSGESTGNYNYIHTGDFSRWKNGHLSEHIMVMEHFIGRQLRDDEVVHHKDFIKDNNLLENLQLMTKEEHSCYHIQLNNIHKFGVPNSSHSDWMRANSFNKRHDVTFESILSAALELDFHACSVQEFLHTDGNVIQRRLVERGFKNWIDFKNKKGQISAFLTRSSISEESRSPTFETIKVRAQFHKTLRSICSDLGCSTQAVSRRLRANGYDSWTAFYASLNGRDVFVARRGPKADPTIRFQTICDVYERGMTQKQLGEAIGTTKNKVLTCILNNGFRSYSEFVAHYQNHKVIQIEQLDDQVVYNITVEKYHNLAVGRQSVIDKNGEKKKINNFIYLENSEMEYTPEISSALDIYSEESTSSDDKGAVLHVYSDNTKIQEILDELFHDILNAEYNITPWVRNLTKFGDMFLFNDVHPELGIINAFPIPVNEVEREEGWDPNDPLAVRYRWVTQGNQVLDAWQVTHFRLTGNDAFLPYGSSILESARRIWRQLILIEDAMLVYRVVRSPERRVFYIDVGNVPAEDIPNYMEAAQSKLKRSQVVDKSSGRVDLRYNPLPCSKNTLIPLLDGRTLTIEMLAKEFDLGKQNWVYSIQDKTNRPVPGLVKWCGRNYTAQKLIRVTLDDGSYIETAPEHPFVLRDGTKKRADDLTEGMRLMPFYRRFGLGCAAGYPMVFSASDEKYLYVHRLVAEDALLDQKVSVEQELDCNKNNGLVVHHKNFNRLDASPSNLQWMGQQDHLNYHASLGRENLIRYNKSEKKRQLTSELNRRRKTAEYMGSVYNGSALHKEHNAIRSDAMMLMWHDQSKSEKTKKNMRMVIPDECYSQVYDLIRSDPNICRDTATIKIRSNATMMKLLRDANSSNNRDVSKIHVAAFMNELKRQGVIDGWTSFKDYACHFKKNHNIASVEVIERAEDVYCMTVVGPKDEDDRHNFAVLGHRPGFDTLQQLHEVKSYLAENNNVTIGYDWTSGIIIGNSVDEDYFIPVRGAENATKIDTLAGGQHVSDIADVEYIQKKLFAALKVPKAYLGYDEALCLTGDTIVPLTDGRRIRLDELVKEFSDNGGKLNSEVFSYDLKQRRIRPGKITHAWETKHVNELIHVTLDNGETVKCTPNHPFLLRSGEYKDAEHLRVGDSLMPLYERVSSKEQSDYLNGYHMHWDVERQMWQYTHREFGHEIFPDLKKFHVIHHINFNPLDNSHSNLFRFRNYRDHHAYHSIMARACGSVAGEKNPNFNSEASFQKLTDTAASCRSFKELYEITGYGPRVVDRLMHENAVSSRQAFSDTFMPKAMGTYRCVGYDITFDDVVRVAQFLGPRANRSNVAKKLDVSTAVVNSRLQTAGWNSWSAFKNIVLRELDAGSIKDAVIKHGTIQAAYDNEYVNSCSFSGFISCVRRHFGSAKALRISLKDEGYAYFQHAEASWTLNNHKVALVERVSYKEAIPVYDLMIENYSNFSIGCGSSGIIVHNSSKATLAQEDIRFSRTISRVQRVILAELNKLSIIHLFVLGFDGDDLTDFALHLSNPSTVAQQQKLELYRTKFEIAGTVPERLVDQYWLRKEILGLSDDEIERVKHGLMEDQRLSLQIDAEEVEGDNTFSGGGGGAGGGGLGGLGAGGEDDTGTAEDDEETTGGEGGSDAGDEESDEEGDLASDGEEEEDLFAAAKPSKLKVSLKDALDDMEDDADERKHKSGKGPVIQTATAKRYKYNRSRRRTHGASKTHMPNFKDMVSGNLDPFDKRFFRKNPLSVEGLEDALLSDNEFTGLRRMRPRVTSEMKSILASLERKISISGRRRATLISEISVTKIDEDVELIIEADDGTEKNE